MGSLDDAVANRRPMPRGGSMTTRALQGRLVGDIHTRDMTRERTQMTSNPRRHTRRDAGGRQGQARVGWAMLIFEATGNGEAWRKIHGAWRVRRQCRCGCTEELWRRRRRRKWKLAGRGEGAMEIDSLSASGVCRPRRPARSSGAARAVPLGASCRGRAGAGQIAGGRCHALVDLRIGAAEEHRSRSRSVGCRPGRG